MFNEKNSMNSKYYEVNLNNIHFMIYDFNKDMLVDGNKNYVCIKIKKILNSSNYNDIFYSGRDGSYPFPKLKHKSTLQKKVEDEENKNIQNEIIDQENSYKRKINEAINNEEDETTIKILKKYSILFFIIMIVCCVLNLFINLHYNYMFKDILYLIKNSISIRYCSKISVYFIRELTLLNLYIPNLNGGLYEEIPAKKPNREKYRLLIRKKINELFIENQSYLTSILSSPYSPSKITLKKLSENLRPVYISKGEYKIIKTEILSTLVQYNNAFYNLAMSDIIIEQNHLELISFIYNSFNEYGKGIYLLIDIYSSELLIQKKTTIIILISILIIFFLLYLIINIIVARSYLSVEITRGNYMKVFYGINISSIKYLMTNCENYLENLKKNEKNMNNDTETKNGEEDNKTLIQKTNENVRRNSLVVEENRNKIEKELISLKNIIFVTIYFGYVLGMYIYYVYNFFCVVELIKSEIDISNFYFRLSIFQLNMIDLFNSYREYIFDDTSIIYSKNSFDFIKQIEVNITDSITSDTKLISTFVLSKLSKNEEISNILNKDICSYYITDYFESSEECHKKFEDTKYDYVIMATNFIQKINSAKNIAKYFLTTKNVVGNLTGYDKEKWLAMGNELLEQDGDKTSIFRLDLFNDKEIHSELNLIFINLFLPYIEANRRALLDKVKVEGKENLIIGLFFLYLFIVFVFFFGYWVPKVRFVNNYIYKTKKILLIIPMNILASQNNIKSVLNL